MVRHVVPCFDVLGGAREQLQAALAEALSASGASQNVSVILTKPDDRFQGHVAVYLGAPGRRTKPAEMGILKRYISNSCVVLPVVPSLADYPLAVPPILGPYNGVEGSPAGGFKAAAGVILSELGIAEKTRKVFISHRRSDGLQAAEQLHDQLGHVGFAAFLDRFDIGPGRDVQSEVISAIEDYPLLVLLETPEAHLSSWVGTEVAYAFAHRIAMVIVRWPGKVTELPTTERMPRLRLRPGDFQPFHRRRRLTRAAVGSIIVEVETSFASAMVRRRKALVSSAIASAKAAGYATQALPEWQLTAKSPRGELHLLRPTPATPTVQDIYELDVSAAQIGTVANSHLVHETENFTVERQQILDWARQRRRLELNTLTSLDSIWRDY